MNTKPENWKITITVKQPHDALTKIFQNYQSNDDPIEFCSNLAFELDDIPTYYDKPGAIHVNIENTTKENK